MVVFDSVSTLLRFFSTLLDPRAKRPREPLFQLLGGVGPEGRENLLQGAKEIAKGESSSGYIFRDMGLKWFALAEALLAQVNRRSTSNTHREEQ